MVNNISDRELKLFNLAGELNLKVFKGVKQQAFIKSENDLVDGYMIVDDNGCRIIAGRNKNGAFQLDIEQAEAVLYLYQEFILKEEYHA